MQKTTKEEQQEIIERYRDGESSPSIASDFNITPKAVRGLLKRRGVKMRSKSEAQRKCTLRRDAFSETNDQSAYWAGFIMADGTIIDNSNGSPTLAVVLSNRDRPHLVKLRKFLGSNHKISEISETSASRFAVRSKQITDDLKQFGVTPNKTHSACVRKLHDNRHFWRGVVDGDGYVNYNEDSKARIELVGAKPLLQQFNSFCTNRIGSDLSVRPHKNIWRVGCFGGTAERLLTLLYQNGDVCLDRKAP